MKEKACHELILNRGFIASESRVALQLQYKNLLESYAKVSINLF